MRFLFKAKQRCTRVINPDKEAKLEPNAEKQTSCVGDGRLAWPHREKQSCNVGRIISVVKIGN